ncbi:hypothetical protein MMC26_000962 [Xylographa opegraphella]|nr:hypothetical protein [Xylographa opegraphella]
MAGTFHGQASKQQLTTLDQTHDDQVGNSPKDSEEAAQIQLPPSLNSIGNPVNTEEGSKADLLDPWEWMSYIMHGHSLPMDSFAAQTSDFGNEDYTASLTDCHEILQLTAPDPLCGLVYARGDFPGTAESMLARAQNRDDGGGKGTFGIQLLQDPCREYQLGNIYVHGLFNYRWPFIEYVIRIKDAHEGLLHICSFVHQKAVYQIAHVQLPAESSAETRTAPTENETRPRSKTFHFRLYLYPYRDFEVIRRLKSTYALVTTEELPPDDVGLKSAVRSNRTSIHHQVEPSFTAFSVSPQSEVPQISDSIQAKVNDPSQQSIGSSTILPPATSTLRQPDDGELLPRSVSLPVSGQSLLIAGDLKARSDENYRIGIGEVDDKDYTHEVLAVALVRNIMNSPYVDLEDAFWQLRFLVKPGQFLQRQFGDFDSPANILEMRPHGSKFHETSVAACKQYQTRLRGVIKGVLLWIVNLKWNTNSMSVMQTDEDMDPHRYLRLTTNHQNQEFWIFSNQIETTANYSKYQPFSSSKWQRSCFVSISINYVLTSCAWIAKELALKSELCESLPTLSIMRAPRDLTMKTALLQWLHSSCLYNILEMVNKIPAGDVETIYWSHVENLKRLCSKLIKSSQNADFDLYTEEEEETHRLILAFHELSSNIASNDYALGYVLKKIQCRVATRVINTGISDSERVAPTQAPWKLSCLNHHTALKVAIKRIDSDNCKAAKDACSKFQSSDLMFLPTWDRTRPSMLEGWWNTDVSSIVCATLLDLCGRPIDNEDSITVQNQNMVEYSSPTMKSNSLPVKWKWLTTAPVFHDEWIQSLEDTPDGFHNSQTKTISLRHSLNLYLRSFEDFGKDPPSYSRDNIYELVPAEDLLYFSLFDIDINFPFTIYYCGPDDLDLPRYRDRFSEVIRAPKSSESLLWAWVIDGHPWECLNNTERLSDEFRVKLQRPNLRQDLFKDHQSEILRRLSDSLVDQNIKFRIM